MIVLLSFTIASHVYCSLNLVFRELFTHMDYALRFLIHPLSIDYFYLLFDAPRYNQISRWKMPLSQDILLVFMIRLNRP
jgi:hypothetical protein